MLRTIYVTLLVAGAVAARASGDESPTLRAAEAGVSPGFCPAVRALLDAAPGGFIGLRGAARRSDEQSRERSSRPPGASDCVILGGAPPAYVCTLYAGDVEKDADGAYDGAVSGVKDCLPAGWKTTEKVDGVHARTTFAAGAMGPSIRVVSRDATGDAYLVELWVGAARRTSSVTMARKLRPRGY